MGLDVKRPPICLLLLFVCGWVALSKATHGPCIYVKVDKQTIQASTKKSLTESHVLDELAESASKNKAGRNAIKGIKGLRLADMKAPNITITIYPEKGVNLNMSSQMTVAGKSFIGGMMEITIKTNISTLTCLKRDPEKQLRFEVNKCAVNLVSCKTNLPSSMLPKIVNKFLHSTLGKILPGMMCPAAEKVVSIMDESINNAFDPNDIGHHGTVQYKLGVDPDLVSEYVGLCLTPVFHDKDGNEVEIPREPPPCEDLPEKEEGCTEIIMPVNILNAMMGLFTNYFSCQITGADTDKVAELRPWIKDLPPTEKLKVIITPQEAPMFSLELGKSSIIVHSTVDVINQDTGTAVLSFKMIQNWESRFSVEAEKLKIESYEVRTSDITDLSLSVDEAGVEALKRFMGGIVSDVCLPKVNEIMAEGTLWLPNMMGSIYAGCEITTTVIKDTLILDVKSEDTPMDMVALREKISHLHDKHH